MSDPFTQAYDALWTKLEAHTGFTGLVKVGDRIKYDTGKKDPEKDSIQNAALPEVRIIDLGGVGGNRKSSNSFSIIRRYQVQVSTDYLTLEGNTSIPDGLYPVEWEIMRAFGIDGDLPGITVGNDTIKCWFSYREFTSNLYNADLSKQKGWVGVIDCEVEFWFSKTHLLPILEGALSIEVIAGDPAASPDCAGVYDYFGIINGARAYRRTTSPTYYLFFESARIGWLIGERNSAPDNVLWRNAAAETGAFSPAGLDCAGTVTANYMTL
jgi:hypothetical protein